MKIIASKKNGDDLDCMMDTPYMESVLSNLLYYKKLKLYVLIGLNFIIQFRSPHGFNIFLKPLKFGYTFRIPLIDFTQSAGIYNRNLQNRVLYFTITYTF